MIESYSIHIKACLFRIKDEEKQWLYVFLLLTGHLFVMSACGIVLNIVDAKKVYHSGLGRVFMDTTTVIVN